MNKHCFRLVFNRARGCLMAVGEAARAQAKAGRVGSLALMVAAPLLAHGQTVATRIVADPGAPATQRPTVLGTANGVVQVNIQTPSAAGVSRNTYRQFDVGTSGAILNNSRTDTPTQLGGWVQGNPWLARGSARVILSEVNSSDPSRLQGAVEVAGPRADVVIANPSGIVVQGGTFINAAGVTLTTGTPLMRDGVLQGYRVQGGTVRIDGNGLDTLGADYTAILSRALEINAGLWARRLQVVTGANEVASTGLGAESAPQATPIEGTGPAPGFALDSSRLGGMYAGQITLVGTEAGLGVRNAGQVLASAGPLVLSQDGWLSNTGRVQAEAVTIQASSLSNVGGQIIQTGRDDQSIALDGRLDNRGGLIATAAHDFRVSAQAIDNTAGQLLHEGSGSFVLTARDKLDNLADGPGQPAVDGGARILSAGTLRLQAGGIASTGRIGSGADLVLEAGSLSGSASHVMAAGLRGHGALTVTTTGALQSAGQVLAADDVALRGATLDLADGLAGSVAGDIALTATRGDLVTKRARVITPGQLVVTAEAAGQVVDNTQGLLRAKSLLIQAGKVDNTRGRIVAAGDARVTAEALHNGAGLISAKGDLSIDSTGLVDNSAGLVRAGQSLNLRAGRVVNTGTLSFDADGKPKDTGLEGRSVVLTAHQVDNRQGAIRAVQDLALRADGALTNDGGELSAGGVLRITGDTAPAPTLRITNQGGQMVADTRAEVRAAALGGAGTLASQGDVVLQLQGDHTLAGTLQAGSDLQIDVAGRLTNPVVVQAGRNLTANAAALDNQATGELTSALATRLKVAGAFTNRGLVDGADTRIEAATVDNVGTGRLYGERMALAANAFTNREEAAGGSVRAATLAGRERVDIGVAHLTNRENALIYSGGDMAIGGALDASGRTTGRAQSVHNQSATIDAARDLGIDAVAIHNTNAHFATEVRLVSQSAVTEFQHRRGDVISTRDTSTRFSDREAGVEWCEASCLRSPAGTSDAYIRYDYTRTVTESAIIQSAPGRILAGRDMHLAAGTLYNDKSHIVAGGAIE